MKDIKLEFIALEGKGIDCEAGIFFSLERYQQNQKCEAGQTRSVWILEDGQRDNFGFSRVSGAVETRLKEENCSLVGFMEQSKPD